MPHESRGQAVGMLTDWLRRVIGSTQTEASTAGANVWAAATPDRSQRLARLGLASGGIGGDGAAAAGALRSAPAPGAKPAARPAAAPQPTLRRDVGMMGRDAERSAMADEHDATPPPAAGPVPAADQSRQPGPADWPQTAPQTHRKRATYRLPTSLLHRLRAASKRTRRYQYQIVADALRTYLPTLESQAAGADGQSDHEHAPPASPDSRSPN